VLDIGIDDGDRNMQADRLTRRLRRRGSRAQILASAQGKHHQVPLQRKLFGVGPASSAAGSNGFYLAYAATHKTVLCLDAGHFHPTESVADKISTALCFVDELLLHVSRPVRWDSDHVVLLDDATVEIAHELVRCGALSKVNLGLDFFDASINRVAAWVIGTGNMRKGLLRALLEPQAQLQQAEQQFDYTTRLALMEEQKSMPWPAIWDYYCDTRGVPAGAEWLECVRKYETEILYKRREN